MFFYILATTNYQKWYKMSEIDNGFMKVYSKYDLIKHKIENNNNHIKELQKELVSLNEEHKRLKSYVDPHITINEIKYNNPDGKRYIGKFRLYLNEDKPKLVTISIGSTKNFKGSDDPEIMKVARDKAISYIKRKFPEVYKK